MSTALTRTGWMVTTTRCWPGPSKVRRSCAVLLAHLVGDRVPRVVGQLGVTPHLEVPGRSGPVQDEEGDHGIGAEVPDLLSRRVEGDPDLLPVGEEPDGTELGSSVSTDGREDRDIGIEQVSVCRRNRCRGHSSCNPGREQDISGSRGPDQGGSDRRRAGSHLRGDSAS